MRKSTILIFLVLCISWMSCKDAGNTAGLEDLDLMSYGLPVKIKAPADAEVEANDLGFVKDITVKSGENFYLQIIGGTATTTDLASIKAAQLNDVQNSPFFSEIISEDEKGFIYKKTISEDRENYDFRYIKIQGDMEYVFQTGLIGQYSLEDVQKMYEAVK